MTGRVSSAVWLFLVVQYRSGFIHVYLAVTLFTVVIVRGLLPEAWREVIVPVLLLTEYGAIGVYMVGAQIYLARNEKSIEALSVTPLRLTERVVATVLAATLVAMTAGVLFFVGLLGVDVRLLLLIAPLFATTVLAGSVGLIVSSRYPEFTRFIIGSIPVVALFSLPLLSYFELVPRYTFAWLPWDAALFSFANIVGPDTHLVTYVVLACQLLVFGALGLFWAVRAEAWTSPSPQALISSSSLYPSPQRGEGPERSEGGEGATALLAVTRSKSVLNQWLALAYKDLRIVYRDRFMLFIAAYALILALVARLGVPWVPVDNLDLFLAPAIVMFGTLLLGTLLGFALIEEREQGTWLLLRVLPLSSKTVLAYFAATASFLSFVVSFAAAMLYGYPVADWPAFVFMLVASALAAPLVMLALGALAKNKIEGLAVSKIISAAGILPVLLFFGPASWQLVAVWCPLYWLYLGLLQAYAGDPTRFDVVNWSAYPTWLPGVASIALSFVGMAMLVRMYTRSAR